MGLDIKKPGGIIESDTGRAEADVFNVKLPAQKAGLPGKERTRHDCAP
jgi:hypothetical protein